jgi:hypothetical protein
MAFRGNLSGGLIYRPWADASEPLESKQSGRGLRPSLSRSRNGTGIPRCNAHCQVCHSLQEAFEALWVVLNAATIPKVKMQAGMEYLF